MGCSRAKDHPHALPKTTDNRATERAERFFVDLAEDMRVPSLHGSKDVMIVVDYYTRFKVVKFLEKKSDATSVLQSFIADFVIPEKREIGDICTGNGEELEEDCEYLLDEPRINHDHTPVDIPQFSVSERTPGMLREKMIALVQDLKEGAKDRLWAEAMKHACDVTNLNRIMSNEGGATPHENGMGLRLR